MSRRGHRRRISTLRQSLQRTDLRRARGARPVRQSRCSSCLFKARRYSSPERLPSIRSVTSRPRWDLRRLGVQASVRGSRHPFACSRVARRRPTTRAPGSHYPVELEDDSGERSRVRLRTPPLGAGKMLLSTSATDSLQSCTCRIAWCSRCARLREPHASWVNPQGQLESSSA